jgi:hypothetical protein
VLHGTLSPLHGVGPDQLRAKTLVGRVERGEVDEVILATSPTLEGEATADWLATALRGFSVKITRIATGVPAGSDIEYADEVTMARAIEGTFSENVAPQQTGKRESRCAVSSRSPATNSTRLAKEKREGRLAHPAKDFAWAKAASR